MLDQELFLDALIRERNRAHRFGEGFMLVVVSLEGPEASSRLPEAVLKAFFAATRHCDIVGWIERGSALRIILTSVDSDEVAARSFDARVRRELAGRVDPDLAAHIAIEREAYSMSGLGGAMPAAGQKSLIGALCEQRTVSRTHELAKRGLDLILSFALLVILTPLFAAIAALVKAGSSGPVLFRQPRVGHRARPFTMLKFRTMRVDADQKVHQQFVTEFITSSGARGPATGDELFKLVKDSRVTPIGHLLRKTSLDELPQLWNVLRGDMSLVGPRPPLQYEVEKYQPWHWRRVLDAKPGVTGLWQVTGRSRTTFDGMVRLDLRYAKTRSIWTDLKILLATPKAVVVGKGAC